MGENNTGIKILIIFIILVSLTPIVFGIYQTVKIINPDFKINTLPVILIIIGIVICWFIATYNSFVSLNQRVKQAQGGIDVYLKKRFDLIPNLVETVKGYKEHEESLLTEIAKLRADYDKRNDQDIKQSEDLNNRFSKLLVSVERYPDLKASEQFLNLQKN